ncbi:MAG: alanine dehydrogenase, partial [Rhodococcus sp. (in: high G+C Gram-positive bacteria)]
MHQLTLGVLSRSRKPDERRLPIHPLHFDRIDADIRSRMFLESGYGEPFGISDEHLATQVAGIGTRAELIARCDVILLPKPQAEDLGSLRPGQTLWGWPHCVQDERLTQIAVDRKLT